MTQCNGWLEKVGRPLYFITREQYQETAHTSRHKTESVGSRRWGTGFTQRDFCNENQHQKVPYSKAHYPYKNEVQIWASDVHNILVARAQSSHLVFFSVLRKCPGFRHMHTVTHLFRKHLHPERWRQCFSHSVGNNSFCTQAMQNLSPYG